MTTSEFSTKILETLAGPLSKYDKICRLWAITRLRLGRPESDAAWDAIRQLTDADTSNALAFLTGFSMGMGMHPEGGEKSLMALLGVGNKAKI